MTNKIPSWAKSLTSDKPLADVIADAQSGTATLVTANPQPGELPALHVGRGTRYGNITWFPIWTDAPVVERDYITKVEAGEVVVVEGETPTVGTLKVENKCDKPVLLLEGMLLEGGWQHRALTQTMLVEAKSVTRMPVVCVEQGRWGGATHQRIGNKSAPAGVRRAIRGIHKSTNGRAVQSSADQGEVWSEVRSFASANSVQRPTESLVEVQNEVEAKLADLQLEKPVALLGQRGVLVAINGNPLALELFDHPDTLAERLETILDAYLPESLIKPFKECRSQIARDFVARIEKLGVEPTVFTDRFRNREDKYVAAELVVRNGAFLHMSALNASHELVLAA